MRATPLQVYVDVNHQGNKAAFARAFGRSPQGVSKMFRSPDKWLIVMSEGKHSIVEIRASMTPQIECTEGK